LKFKFWQIYVLCKNLFVLTSPEIFGVVDEFLNLEEFKDLYSIFKPRQSKEQGKSGSVLGLKNS